MVEGTAEGFEEGLKDTTASSIIVVVQDTCAPIEVWHTLGF